MYKVIPHVNCPNKNNLTLTYIVDRFNMLSFSHNKQSLVTFFFQQILTPSVSKRVSF